MVKTLQSTTLSRSERATLVNFVVNVVVCSDPLFLITIYRMLPCFINNWAYDRCGYMGSFMIDTDPSRSGLTLWIETSRNFECEIR